MSAQLHVAMERDSGSKIVLGNAKMKVSSMNMKNVTWAAVQVNIYVLSSDCFIRIILLSSFSFVIASLHLYLHS